MRESPGLPFRAAPRSASCWCSMAGSGGPGQRNPACPRALPGADPAVLPPVGAERGSQLTAPVPCRVRWARRPGLRGGSRAFPRARVLSLQILTEAAPRTAAFGGRYRKGLRLGTRPSAGRSGLLRRQLSLGLHGAECPFRVPKKSHRATCFRLPKWVTCFSVGRREYCCLLGIKTVSFRAFKCTLKEALKLEQNLRTS